MSIEHTAQTVATRPRPGLSRVAALGVTLVALVPAMAQTPAPGATGPAPGAKNAPSAPPPAATARPGTPVLSSPIGAPAAPAAPVATAPGAPPPGLAPGSGPGYHDPRSAFKPLEEREGVVSWKLLSSVTAKVERDRVLPVFPQPVKALDGQSLKVQGFMLPLEPGERQRHFLLSAVPTTCSFCVPAGPEGLIEVRTKEPVRYTVDAVTLQGRFAVLTNDKFGLFYRVADASLVSP